jgi:RNA polymerase sigma-70 factor (ECF subfamily)
LKFFVAYVEDRDRTLKVAIHRLRNRYREIFRQEIADTGVNPAKVEAELRYLTIMLTRK